MKLICIANPKSKNGTVGRSLSRLRDVLANKSVDNVILDLTSENFRESLINELVACDDPIVMGIGGDGTHFSLINTLHDLLAAARISSLPRYCLCPMGTGNDVAKSIGQRVGLGNMDAAVDVALNGKDMSFDLGELDGRLFLDMSSSGLDVRILRIRDDLTDWLVAHPSFGRWIHGYLTYFLAGLASLFDGSRWQMTVIYDDDVVESGRYAGILINNGPIHAGEFILTPRAKVDDGLFDVRLFKNRFSYALAFARGWRVWSKWIGGRGGKQIQCRSIEVKCDSPIPIQVDGEQFDLRDEFKITVRHAALTLRVPR